MKKYLLLFVKGLGMGAADVVPGVSGGTIAFITGIYQELIQSIKQVDIVSIKLLLSLQFKEFWSRVNGGFLLTVLLGIAVSIFSFSRVMFYFLETHPIKVWSFFFGLIIISAITILRQVKKWNFRVVTSLALGIVIAYYITVATPATTPESSWFIFLSGAIAICAMILPGISGAFILLILGKYEFITEALHQLNITVILIFLLGCVVGLLSFVRAVSWVLNKYYYTAVALLSGFMIGSLNKVWPWKKVVSYRITEEGEQVPMLDQNIWPNEYMEYSGTPPEILYAILFMSLGIVVVVLMEKVAHNSQLES